MKESWDEFGKGMEGNVSRTDQIGWLGIGAVIGGALFAIYEVGTGLLSSSFAEAPFVWSLLHIVGMMAAFFLLLGVVGIYAYQADQGIAIGLLVFVITILGIVAFLAWAWGGAVIIPAIVTYDPEFLSAPSDAWLYTNIFLISHLLLAVGSLLFGIMTWRINLLPRGAAALVVVSSIIGAIDAIWNLGAVDPPFGPIILGGIGFAWMGITLWRPKAELIEGKERG